MSIVVDKKDEATGYGFLITPLYKGNYQRYAEIVLNINGCNFVILLIVVLFTIKICRMNSFVNLYTRVRLKTSEDRVGNSEACPGFEPQVPRPCGKCSND